MISSYVRASNLEQYSGETRIASFDKGSVSSTSADEIIGDGHPWRGKTARRIFRDVGGPVTVSHQRTDIYPTQVQGRTAAPGSQTGNWRYAGLISGHLLHGPSLNPSFVGIPTVLNDSTLRTMGVKAWNASKPTKPEGSLGQMIGEAHQVPSIPLIKSLRDSLKEIPKGLSLGKLLSRAGGEFLNVGFGWLPLVSDARDFIVNTVNLDKKIAQLIRDNGRPVRRTKRLDGGSSNSTTVGSNSGLPGTNIWPILDSSMYDGMAQVITEVQTNWDYRFHARFRYYIDFEKARNGDINEMRKLLRMSYGLDFNLSTLYELMPWSWLLDWFGNIGDNLSNMVDDQDRLVADYAYINGRYRQITTTSVYQKMKFSDGDPVRMQTVTTRDIFRRVQANHFGFGLTFGDLSSKQLAILAALGLSKLS